MLCAVIPEDWVLENHVGVRNSCDRFIRNPSTGPGRRVNIGTDEDTLARVLDRAVRNLSRSAFMDLCEAAHAERPAAARETEKQFHSKTRAAVRWTGIDPWG